MPPGAMKPGRGSDLHFLSPACHLVPTLVQRCVGGEGQEQASYLSACLSVCPRVQVWQNHLEGPSTEGPGDLVDSGGVVLPRDAEESNRHVWALGSHALGCPAQMGGWGS